MSLVFLFNDRNVPVNDRKHNGEEGKQWKYLVRGGNLTATDMGRSEVQARHENLCEEKVFSSYS